MKAESPVLVGYPVEEFTLGHGVEGVPAHPVVRWDDHTFVSRHTLTDSELEEIIRTREIYVFHGSVERRLLPVRLQVTAPEFTLRVLKVDLPSGSEFCHGLEVVDAGGTEADRADYVATEGAGLLAATVRLPARVALLNLNTPPALEGGEQVEGRTQLEEALAKRLKKALDLGRRRVEVVASSGDAFYADVIEMTPRQIAEGALVSVPG